MVTPTSIRVNLVAWLLLVSTGSGAGDGGPFELSPPATVPAESRNEIQTNLRDLKDAHGLALLVVDDQAARTIGNTLQKWEAGYQSRLASDPVLL
jgi:hypothetical protein